MKQWINRTNLAGAVTLAAAVAGSGCSPETEHPPNIIVFMVDDMGWQDTSVINPLLMGHR